MTEQQIVAKVMDLLDSLESLKSETANEHLARVLGLSASALSTAVRDAVAPQEEDEDGCFVCGASCDPDDGGCARCEENASR